MIAKSNTFAVAGVLAALVTAAATAPAAAKDPAPSYEACYSLAIDRGAGPNKGGGTKEHSQHNSFMDQCMTGKLPMAATSTSTATSTPSVANLQGNTFASTASSKHVNRRPGISKAAN
jgi:hypothetical protein